MATIRSTLWGGETTKAVDNFPISGEPVPASVVHWLGRIKGAAARVNAELGLLDADARGARSPRRPTRSPRASTTTQFPIDVFQTGSGTSSNMNANEVIATLAGDGAHPNDHVNMGQSSNDVFPSRRPPRRARRGDEPAAARARAARAVVRGEGRASSRTSSSPAART